MPAYGTADARTALMATYFARRPQALSNPVSSSPPLRQYDANVSTRRLPGSQEKRSPGGLAMRGRTIYNADQTPTSSETKSQTRAPAYSTLAELQRIDAEEERRRTLGYEFLMGSSGNFEVPVRGPGGMHELEWEDERAQEMFELYICMQD